MVDFNHNNYIKYNSPNTPIRRPRLSDLKSKIQRTTKTESIGSKKSIGQN